MGEFSPVDLDSPDRNDRVYQSGEQQHKLITRQALREFGLFPRIADTEYYHPDDILEVLRTIAAQADQASK